MISTSDGPIYFLTGSEFKMREIGAILPRVQQLKVDLPEIQDLNPHTVVRAKLQAAFAHHEGPFIVEDTSCTIDGMGQLPGPFIKWFELELDHIAFIKMARALGNGRIIAKTIIGYAENVDAIRYFEGTLTGALTEPRGGAGFGWDPIFLPDGHTQTLAEMGAAEKNRISYRRQAVDKLIAALQ